MTPSRKLKRPSIAQPVPVPEIREYAAPLPEPRRQSDQQRRWDWYMRKARWRDYVQKERRA